MAEWKKCEVKSSCLDDDPFVILPANLKNYEKLGADLFFNLLVKIALYSLVVSIRLRVLPGLNGRNVTNNSIKLSEF